MSSSKSKSRRHHSDSEDEDRRASKSSVFERLGGSSKGWKLNAVNQIFFWSFFALCFLIRQAKLIHKICVGKGNAQPWGREVFYFEFYIKIV